MLQDFKWRKKFSFFLPADVRSVTVFPSDALCVLTEMFAVLLLMERFAHVSQINWKKKLCAVISVVECPFYSMIVALLAAVTNRMKSRIKPEGISFKGSKFSHC